MRASKSGSPFRGRPYSGNGTATISTPEGDFVAGEKVYVNLTTGLACPDPPRQVRYRVQSRGATGNFVSGPSHAVGEGPAVMKIGDLTGNGILDLATVDSISNTVTILLGNGDGTFNPQPPIGAGSDPVHVDIGDFSDDGTFDLAVVDRTADIVTVLLGAGDGSFPEQETFAVGNTPRAVVQRDLIKNGILDLAIANGDGTVSILLGNHDGTFHAHATFPVGPDPRHLAAEDLDGDGVFDLAFATNSGNIAVLLGNGDGTFQTPLTSSTAGAPQRFVALDDLDGDAVDDLVFVASSEGDVVGNAVHVMLGNGDGTFQTPQAFATGETGTNAGMVAIGDLTGNGILDLVTPNLDGANITVFLGAGDGTFPTVQSVPVGGDKTFAAIGDLTGNDVLDIAVATSDDVVQVLLGQALP